MDREYFKIIGPTSRRINLLIRYSILLRTALISEPASMI